MNNRRDHQSRKSNFEHRWSKRQFIHAQYTSADPMKPHLVYLFNSRPHSESLLISATPHSVPWTGPISCVARVFTLSPALKSNIMTTVQECSNLNAYRTRTYFTCRCLRNNQLVIDLYPSHLRGTVFSLEILIYHRINTVATTSLSMSRGRQFDVFTNLCFVRCWKMSQEIGFFSYWI